MNSYNLANAQGKTDTETIFIVTVGFTTNSSIIRQLWKIGFALCIIKALRLARIEHCSGTVVTPFLHSVIWLMCLQAHVATCAVRAKPWVCVWNSGCILFSLNVYHHNSKLGIKMNYVIVIDFNDVIFILRFPEQGRSQAEMQVSSLQPPSIS